MKYLIIVFCLVFASCNSDNSVDSISINGTYNARFEYTELPENNYESKIQINLYNDTISIVDLLSSSNPNLYKITKDNNYYKGYSRLNQELGSLLSLKQINSNNLLIELRNHNILQNDTSEVYLTINCKK